MNAAVTGGTGFFGRALIRLLVPQADAVRALVRTARDVDELRAMGASPIRGDLTRPGGCDGLVSPGDVVFHAAARVETRGSWADFQRTTVAGTRRLLASALPLRPRRFVYVSSAAVYAVQRSGVSFSAERTPAAPPAYNLYGRAKLAAERLVRRACARAGCPWTIVRLGFLYGPGNLKSLDYFERLAQRRRLCVIGRGENRIAVLYVDDAARAVLLAGTHPAASGRVYDVADDEPVTQRRFLDAGAEAFGVARPRRRTPRCLAYFGAGVAELLGRLSGPEVLISRAMVMLMGTDQMLDSGAIRRELGWRPEVAFEDGMRLTREWRERLRGEKIAAASMSRAVARAAHRRAALAGAGARPIVTETPRGGRQRLHCRNTTISTGSGSPGAMEKPPNILLIVVDCARSDKWVGAGRTTVTPNLDRLCRDSVVFPTTITEKSCTTPSFATLLTGLYSPRHGVHLVWGYRLPGRVPMLTDLFAARGYHTYAEVSGPLLPEMGLDRGFESYEYRAPCDYLHTAWGDHFVERLRSGHYREPWFLMLHLWELHPERQVLGRYRGPQFGRDEYERAIASLDAQLARVFDAAGEDSAIAFTGDHGEKTADEEYREGTAVAHARKLLGIEEAGGLAPYQVANWAGPSVLQQLYGQCAPLMRNVRLSELRHKQAFGRWARFRDRLRLLRLTPWVRLHDLLALGTPLKLTQMLKRRGLLDEGRSRAKVERLARSLGRDELLDMHMRMWTNSYKHNMREGHMVHVYDFLVRVPLVLRWPGKLRRGVVHERMVRQPDILPTLLALAGVDGAKTDGIDGRPFHALVEGRPWEPQPAYLSVSGIPADLEIRGVRTEQYKYTFGPENPELPEELYDLRQDPGETRNLAATDPERTARLRALANSFLPTGGEQPLEEMALSADQQQRVEKHLRELGYLE